MGLSPWDVAAGGLLVREAGGFVGDLGGGDNWLETGDILAANPRWFQGHGRPDSRMRLTGCAGLRALLPKCCTPFASTMDEACGGRGKRV